MQNAGGPSQQSSMSGVHRPSVGPLVVALTAVGSIPFPPSIGSASTLAIKARTVTVNFIKFMGKKRFGYWAWLI